MWTKPERRIDLTIEPTPEAARMSFFPPRHMRVYDSTLPGMMTVILQDEDKYIDASTRLDVDQVIELRDALNEWLRVERP